MHGLLADSQESSDGGRADPASSSVPFRRVGRRRRPRPARRRVRLRRRPSWRHRVQRDPREGRGRVRDDGLACADGRGAHLRRSHSPSMEDVCCGFSSSRRRHHRTCAPEGRSDEWGGGEDVRGIVTTCWSGPTPRLDDGPSATRDERAVAQDRHPFGGREPSRGRISAAGDPRSGRP